MKSLQRNRPLGGFTLIELLIVVAIIGIIAVLLVPNFLDSLQKAKQKRTITDQKVIGSAMMNWLTDQASAAAAGFTETIAVSDFTGTSDFDEIYQALSPQNLNGLPQIDGWNHDFLIVLDIDNPDAKQVMLIASGGRDGELRDTYDFGTFSVTDYDEDIVWADGFFVRWPEGSQTN